MEDFYSLVKLFSHEGFTPEQCESMAAEVVGSNPADWDWDDTQFFSFSDLDLIEASTHEEVEELVVLKQLTSQFEKEGLDHRDAQYTAAEIIYNLPVCA